MAEVAAGAAGVSKPLLYHYFSTKSELYVAAVRSAAHELSEASRPDPVASHRRLDCSTRSVLTSIGSLSMPLPTGRSCKAASARIDDVQADHRSVTGRRGRSAGRGLRVGSTFRRRSESPFGAGSVSSREPVSTGSSSRDITKSAPRSTPRGIGRRCTSGPQRSMQAGPMRVSPLTVETIPKAVDGLTSKLVPACRIRRGSSPNSPLGIGICPRCSPRRSNDLNAFRLNTSSKTSPNRWSRSWIRKRNGVERDSRPSDKFPGDLGWHELAPCVAFGTWPPLGGGDPPDARCRDLDAHLKQLALDAAVAPQGVLLG